MFVIRKLDKYLHFYDDDEGKHKFSPLISALVFQCPELAKKVRTNIKDSFIQNLRNKRIKFQEDWVKIENLPEDIFLGRDLYRQDARRFRQIADNYITRL